VPSANQACSGHAEISFHDLVQTYFDCRQHKRNTRSALAFESRLESNLVDLYDDIVAGRYTQGPSTCFPITRPKAREVWAANFRDRIVQHLLYNRVAQRFHNRFIADSCACIPGRGTLYAARRAESHARSVTQNWTRPAYYLKCDIANFFVSIDKVRLLALLDEHIHEPWWRALTHQLINHDPRVDVFVQGDPARLKLIPPHKSLFTQPAHRGLPIGNLLSQFSANVYMNVADQYAKHVIGARHYVRYVDDILVMHESKDWLRSALASLAVVLREDLGLELNPRKTIIQPVHRGVDFAGQVMKPWRRSLRRRVVNDALARCKVSPEPFESINSYFGLMRQASHSHGDRRRLARVALQRGHVIDLRLTKCFRRSEP
jgi:RNA-directed DNA polymerase